jgi:hypothetical protein
MDVQIAAVLGVGVAGLWLAFGIAFAVPCLVAYERQARRYAMAWQLLRADWRAGTSLLLKTTLVEDPIMLLMDGLSQHPLICDRRRRGLLLNKLRQGRARYQQLYRQAYGTARTAELSEPQ